MPLPETSALAEREQTDESLRAEREKADNPPGEEASSADATADAVINLARQRADLLLAQARAESDRRHVTAPAAGSRARRRVREDRVLQRERSDADDVLRAERVAHMAALAVEREETDRDLQVERTKADHAVATRDEFLGVVTHDLRNMLHSVIGFANLIVGGARDLPADTTINYAQRIARSGSRMTRLVGDLLDVAGIQAGALAVTRIESTPGAVVAEAVETFQERAAASGLTLTQEVLDAGSASFDPARILQVLANLIGNAIKFTREGSVTVQVEPAGEDVRFSVVDTGPGIPPDRLESIFERYTQGDSPDRRGVGLGLYISKSIIQGHGGRIWAESTLGKGSAYHFSFPRRPPVTA